VGHLGRASGPAQAGAGSRSLTDHDASQHLLTRAVASTRFFETPKSERIQQKNR
jgi:hypothetical protein